MATKAEIKRLLEIGGGTLPQRAISEAELDELIVMGQAYRAKGQVPPDPVLWLLERDLAREEERRETALLVAELMEMTGLTQADLDSLPEKSEESLRTTREEMRKLRRSWREPEK